MPEVFLDLTSDCNKYINCTRMPRLSNAIQAPWVIIKIKGQSREVTVGNSSLPAVVKSFTYGGSTGAGCTIEIWDEEGAGHGGDFRNFLNQISQTLPELRSKYSIQARWGWALADCENPIEDAATGVSGVIGGIGGGLGGGIGGAIGGGVGGSIAGNPFVPRPSQGVFQGAPPITATPFHTFTIKKISIKYENGAFKYVLECSDMMAHFVDHRVECVFGEEGKPMRLKEAIRKLLSEHVEPAITNVDFWRLSENGGPPIEWEFKTWNNRTAEGIWKCNQQNALQVIQRWISEFVTDEGRGITMHYNSLNDSPHLIFWEDFKPKCNNNGGIDGERLCKKAVRSYIVNGGKFSPVISFTPQIRWIWGALAFTGGFAGGPMDGKMGKQKSSHPTCDFGSKQAGTQTANQATDNLRRLEGNEDANDSRMKADAQNQLANITYQSISAELRIQGDPGLASIIPVVGRGISLMVVNPFRIVSYEGDDCDWTVAPTPCNPILSNRGWLIKEFWHEIKEGSYTTTLNLFLPAPGSDIDIGLPWGAEIGAYTSS